MKLTPQASRDAIAIPQLRLAGGDDESGYLCRDGQLMGRDVAKAARCSMREAKRGIDAFCAADKDSRKQENGALLTFQNGKTGIPDPATQTRAQMALIVAERIGLGRFALKKQIAERDEERRMSAQQHAWNLGTHGRHVGSKQGGGVIATLTCERCPTVEVIEFRQLAGPDAMDRKFIQKGWAVDPTRCPEHNRRNHRKGDSMASAPTAPSPAAIAAQAKMFGLLQTHFDP